MPALVCPSCKARWKILPGLGDRCELCPCCPSLPASVAEAAPVAEPMSRAKSPDEARQENDAQSDFT